MVLKEAIAYYVQHDSSVYCTMLDATKAFDRVNYCKLFRLLVGRKITAAWLRLLVNMYTNNNTRIAWNGICSATFLVYNGVKQGGVMSPILFCIYLDELLNILAAAKVGCYIGPIFVGVLAYADDLVLLAPTTGAMRRMLNICDSYATEYAIVFNAKKSRWLFFSSSNYDSPNSVFCIGGSVVERVHSWPHLGHIISDDRNDETDIIARGNSLCGQINNVISYFRNRTSLVKLSLMRAYCSSFYGCELWELDHTKLELICTTWRKGLRRIWDLPYDTHNNLLPVLCNSLPIMDELCCRSVNFINNCLVSESHIVRSVAYHSVFVSRAFSPLGRNAQFCCKRYEASLFDLQNINTDFIKHCYFVRIDSDLVSKAIFLLELLFIRDGSFVLPGNGLSSVELSACIRHVCREV
jgi:hypothetical protein